VRGQVTGGSLGPHLSDLLPVDSPTVK
jgi:hypothetical protein